MFAATKILRQAAGAAHAERTPMIKFIGKRSIPSSVDHTPQAHPASPTHSLPEGFGSSTGSSASFSSYRQQAQQHGPLGKPANGSGSGFSPSGHSLGPVTPAKGEYFDRNDLGPRYRRAPYTEAEIEAIESGGATAIW